MSKNNNSEVKCDYNVSEGMVMLSAQVEIDKFSLNYAAVLHEEGIGFYFYNNIEDEWMEIAPELIPYPIYRSFLERMADPLFRYEMVVLENEEGEEESEDDAEEEDGDEDESGEEDEEGDDDDSDEYEDDEDEEEDGDED